MNRVVAICICLAIFTSVNGHDLWRDLLGARGQEPRSLVDRSLLSPSRAATGRTPLQAQRRPLAFIENAGQWTAPARFVAQRGDMTVHLESGAIGLLLDRLSPLEGGPPCGWESCKDEVPFLMARRYQGVLVRMEFEGFSETAEILGEDQVSGRFNYFLGNDPARWRTDLPGYASVLYAGLYDGIDLRVRGGEALAYDLLLSPWADLDQVRIHCRGIDRLEIVDDGSMRLHSAFAPIRMSPPVTWSVGDDGEQRPVACAFRRFSETSFGFAAPEWDRSLPLVIDPGLSWATYLGSTNSDIPKGMKLDSADNVIVVGATRSSTGSNDFPVTPGAFDVVYSGATFDGYVAKLEPDGTDLVFATYLGGSVGDNAWAVDILSDDSIAVGTLTVSPDYPVTLGAFDETFNGGAFDVGVSVLAPAGNQLIFSTLLGGDKDDGIWDLTVDSQDRVLVSGNTNSTDFPVTPGAYQTTVVGNVDAFVARLSQDGSCLSTSTLIGSPAHDNARVVDVNAAGEIYIAGNTFSGLYPTTGGALDPGDGTGGPVISCFDAAGTRLLASTYFGTTGLLQSMSVGTDQSIFVGISGGSAAMTTPGTYDPIGTGGGTLVGRADGTLTTLLSGTLVASPGNEIMEDMAVDDEGGVVFVGTTSGTGYPTTLGAFDTEFASSRCDGILTRLDPSFSKLVYSTYLGEPSLACQILYDVEIDSEGETVVVGTVFSPAFPATPGAFDETYNGTGASDNLVLRLQTKSRWDDLGQALDGSVIPRLDAEGSLCPGTPARLDLEQALPNGLVHLIIGLSTLEAPVHGGTLVPALDVLLAGIPTNGAGAVSLQGTWPVAVPSGFETYFQYWMPDAGAPYGWAASNALRATSP